MKRDFISSNITLVVLVVMFSMAQFLGKHCGFGIEEDGQTN